jgi:creatinine amidohydrolase
MLKSHWWRDFSTHEFAELDMSRIVAVVPIGAVEQHGAHLLVRVDAAINAGIVARAVELAPDDLPTLILPALSVGKSDEHLAFPGTLASATKRWRGSGSRSARAYGGRAAAGHGHRLPGIACQDGMFRGRLFVVPGDRQARPVRRREPTHGIHGGEVETSIMLHLHPELVDMTRARNFVPLSVELAKSNAILAPEGAVGFGWQAQDLQAAGACGNAAAADAERGRQVVDRAARGLIARRPLAAGTNHRAHRIKSRVIVAECRCCRRCSARVLRQDLPDARLWDPVPLHFSWDRSGAVSAATKLCYARRWAKQHGQATAAAYADPREYGQDACGRA